MDTGRTLADALIVVAIAGMAVAYLYFRHLERKRRLEIVHQERITAMEKGIPLPELPLDPPRALRTHDPRVILIHGIVWTALGLGSMVGLILVRPIPDLDIWPLTLPLLFLGIALMLYYALDSYRTR
jgi:hypothetical protein